MSYTGYIYCIENKINGKKYIGKTERRDINERWAEHYYSLIKNKHGNDHLQKSWNKHEEKNFIWYVLEDIVSETSEILNSTANQLEKHYIKHYNSSDGKFGYNKTLGGDGVIPNEETRLKQSNSAKGEKNSQYGMIRSEEEKKRISDVLKGRVPWNKGIPMRKESKEKVSIATSGEKNPFYGKKHTVETKNIISKKATGRKHTSQSKQKISKASIEKYQKQLEENKNMILEIYLRIMNGEHPKKLAIEYNRHYSSTILKIKNKKEGYGELIDNEINSNGNYKKLVEKSLLFILSKYDKKYFNTYFNLKHDYKEVINIFLDKNNVQMISKNYDIDEYKISLIKNRIGVYNAIIRFHEENVK